MASYGFGGYSVRLRPAAAPLSHGWGRAVVLREVADCRGSEVPSMAWRRRLSLLCQIATIHASTRHATGIADRCPALVVSALADENGTFFFRATVTVNRVHGAAVILVLHPLEYGYSIGCCGSAYSKRLLEYG